jgi:hypothetical protein
MPVLRPRTVVLAVLIGIALMHVAWSTAMAALLSSRYSHRMVDVRRWPAEVEVRGVTQMVSMYLHDTVASSAAPTTVFFGSSVAYGYPWQEEASFAARYAAMRPSEHVYNASVIGADLAFTENAILCGATNAGVTVDTAVVELQVVLSVNSLARIAFWNFAPPAPCDETIGPVGHWSFAMRHPLGAGWLPFIWDDKASPKPDRGLEVAPVYAGYFISRADYDNLKLQPQLHAQVAAVLNRAKTIARRVYAFPSPVYLPGVRDARYEAESVHRQQIDTLAACRAVPDVQCLDTEAFYTQLELYWNLTHFNQHGQRVFAEWLARQIHER